MFRHWSQAVFHRAAWLPEELKGPKRKRGRTEQNGPGALRALIIRRPTLLAANKAPVVETSVKGSHGVAWSAVPAGRVTYL